MTEARPPLVLCSGSLGSAPLSEKIDAAAAAGFEWVSLYGHEYRAAVDAGIDVAALLADHALRVAEVDGVAITLSDPDLIDQALEIATATAARSITIVETRSFDANDPMAVDAAVRAFGEACDLAADQGVLVHIEPFAWSDLGSTMVAADIVSQADRRNGGLLLDLWHHVRGPDAARLDPSLPPSMLFGIQLADTVADPWPDVRDECMGHRLLPGEGSADLPRRLAELSARGPLPPIGVEVFSDALADAGAHEAARRCRVAVDETLTVAGL